MYPAAETIVPTPEQKLVRRALATLVDVQQYVDTKRFTIAGLQRGLGKRASDLEAEMTWLEKNGYVAREGTSFELTRQGKVYESTTNDAEEEPE